MSITTSNLGAVMRPTRLKNFIGQEHVVEQIQTMLKKKNFPSSILISGPTGCGKTTLAYLIARYLNCEKGTSCGKCNSCKMMRSILSGGSHPDVTHIDAGTRGRIEDVRNLIGLTSTMPLTNKRVFIIDECHALTTASMNALLITLENPPPDTVFILCTTEPHKLLPTANNRCTHFAMKLVDAEVIAGRLQEVVEHFADKEDVKISKKHQKKIDVQVQAISEASGGFVRNALSILQAVLYVLLDPDFDPAAVEVQIQQSSDADVQKAAVNAVVAYLKMDLIEVISAIRSVDDYMGFLNKCRWIVHAMIGEVAKSNRFLSPDARECLAVVRKSKLKYGLPQLIHLQNALNTATVDITSKAIHPSVLVENALTYTMVCVYEGKLKT